MFLGFLEDVMFFPVFWATSGVAAVHHCCSGRILSLAGQQSWRHYAVFGGTHLYKNYPADPGRPRIK